MFKWNFRKMLTFSLSNIHLNKISGSQLKPFYKYENHFIGLRFVVSVMRGINKFIFVFYGSWVSLSLACFGFILHSSCLLSWIPFSFFRAPPVPVSATPQLLYRLGCGLYLISSFTLLLSSPHFAGALFWVCLFLFYI